MRRLAGMLNSEAALGLACLLFFATCAAAVIVVATQLDDRGRIHKLEKPTDIERRQDIRDDLRACLPSPRCRADVLAFARALERAAHGHRQPPRARPTNPNAGARTTSPGAAAGSPSSTGPTATPERGRRRRRRASVHRTPARVQRPSAPASGGASPTPTPAPSPAPVEPDVGLDLPCIDVGLIAVGCTS